VLDIFGKAGAALIPLMKEMAENGRLNAKVSTEQSDAAKELEIAWRRTSAEGGAFSKRLALDLMPTLASLIDYLTLTKMGIVQIGSSLTVVANDVATFAQVASAAIFSKTPEDRTATIKSLLDQRNRFIEAANEDAETRLTGFKSLRDKIDATLAGEGKKEKKKGLDDYVRRDTKDPIVPRDRGGNHWFDEAIHQIDAANKSTEEFVRTQRLAIEKMDFENGLIGKSADERARLTAVRAIDNDVALKSITMTEDQREELRRLADVMKGRLMDAYDRTAEARTRWQNGISDGTAKYLDEVRNVAGQAERFVTSANQTMEDSFIKLATTGKFEIKDIFSTLAAEAARAAYRNQFAPAVASGVAGATSWLGKMLGLNSGNNGAASGGAEALDAMTSMWSYAGGGYTGNGSRAGGLDGQGGFLAMMHPQESVIDHTVGGGNAAPNVVVQVLNQSGQALSAKAQGAPQFDGDNWVIGVVMDRAATDPAFRAAFGVGR
jgi:hypothetical protein